MLDKIEHNISQNAGLGFFITVIIGFVALVISQPYITKYLFSFMGFFIALTICSFFVLGVWKVRESLDEKYNLCCVRHPDSILYLNQKLEKFIS